MERERTPYPLATGRLVATGAILGDRPGAGKTDTVALLVLRDAQARVRRDGVNARSSPPFAFWSVTHPTAEPAYVSPSSTQIDPCGASTLRHSAVRCRSVSRNAAGVGSEPISLPLSG